MIIGKGSCWHTSRLFNFFLVKNKCAPLWKNSMIHFDPRLQRSMNLGKVQNLITPFPLIEIGKIWNWDTFEIFEPPLSLAKQGLNHIQMIYQDYFNNMRAMYDQISQISHDLMLAKESAPVFWKCLQIRYFCFYNKQW